MTARRRVYSRHKEENACGFCGNINDRPGFALCSACSGQQQKARKVPGKCRSCGKVNDRKEFLTCSICSNKKKERYESRKALGLCVSCGAPAPGGRIRCDKHSNKK